MFFLSKPPLGLVPDSARWYRLSAPGDQHTALWRPFHGQVTVVAATWILEDPARWSIYCYNIIYIRIYTYIYSVYMDLDAGLPEDLVEYIHFK